MKCNNDDCQIVEHDAEYCPLCKRDENGADFTDDDYENHYDTLAARDYEYYMHGGSNNDWGDQRYDSRYDSISYNDAGEPIGYC